jgi:uncharacterized damage-inducible protein DinB
MILRELEAMKREIAAFADDSGPWALAPGVTNSAGTLALHCAGNLQHFIGARLGQTGYVRQRELEFSRRDVPRAEIIAELDRAIAAVETLRSKSLADLPAVFPDDFGGKRVNTDAMLIHLATHLGYHLGQMDYHRRMTTGNTVTIDAVAASQLPPAD